MPSYWDRFAQTYTKIGEADSWPKYRLRLTDGLSGRVLEVCCGGRRLVVEMLKMGIDAYGIDLSANMVALAQAKLVQAGFEPERIFGANVIQLAFRSSLKGFAKRTVSASLCQMNPSKQRRTSNLRRKKSRKAPS